MGLGWGAGAAAMTQAQGQEIPRRSRLVQTAPRSPSHSRKRENAHRRTVDPAARLLGGERIQHSVSVARVLWVVEERWTESAYGWNPGPGNRLEMLPGQLKHRQR